MRDALLTLTRLRCRRVWTPIDGWGGCLLQASSITVSRNVFETQRKCNRGRLALLHEIRSTSTGTGTGTEKGTGSNTGTGTGSGSGSTSRNARNAQGSRSHLTMERAHRVAERTKLVGAMATGTSRQPGEHLAGDGEPNCGEGVVEVAFRPRSRARRALLAVGLRGENAAPVQQQ